VPEREVRDRREAHWRYRGDEGRSRSWYHELAATVPADCKPEELNA
jgi:hypothetical protein